MKIHFLKKTPLYALVATSLVLGASGTALSMHGKSGQWSRFRSLGNDVSYSDMQVSRNTWTWKFRNDGRTKITSMTFRFGDKDGWHDDVFPGSLAPGAAFGGWASFTASSRPEIILKQVTRK